MNHYRPDIDGLRAVAVLSVVIYHAFPGALPGGFIGVDIFFAISGYLITGIILRELETGRFSIARFYSRRIRRIFPALLLVLAATLLLGWLALTQYDFQQLGRHIVAAAAFAGNLLLWRETGDYFDAAEHFKPLLHLWSLGVEEQYYLLWPVLLRLVRGPRALWLIGAIAACSFAANLLSMQRNPMDAFYLPHTRFWELMFGSLLAYLELHSPRFPFLTERRRDWLSLLGTALLAVGLFGLDAAHPFPGWRALIPVLAATLLISSGPGAVVNQRFLSIRSVVYIGLISYPLYLWHWPLLSFLRIVHDDVQPAAWLRGVTLLVAILLAALTYQLVERRVRESKGPIIRPIVAGLTSAMLAAAALGLLVYSGKLQARVAGDVQVQAISAAMRDWEFRGNRTLQGAGESVLLAGDSLMQHFLPRLDLLQAQSRLRTVVIDTQNGCLPIPGIERPGRWQCSQYTAALFVRAAASDIHTVVLAGAWSGRDDFEPVYYRVGDPDQRMLNIDARQNTWVWDNLRDAMRRLTDSGKQVVLILEPPRGSGFDPRLMATHVGLTLQAHMQSHLPRTSATALVADVNQRLKSAADEAGARWLDPADWLCSATECAVLAADGAPLYKDMLHLRASFARTLGLLDALVLAPSQSPTNIASQ